ncbi:unnamed protein product [Strongylus vulgaris]|uniref:MYND-type domain-containing protein n=1 Tax=Strongylus vulgaris TaxID=40348 RepID=A0A3P7M3M0_STRVU|nr:unnamed protein product [Strongylus vulgaris]
MRAPVKAEHLSKCAACDFVRYCSKDCQRLAWKIHRPECRRLKAVFPNLPLTEVLFLSKIIDRVVFLAMYGDKFNWERERKFSSLVDHKKDIRYALILLFQPISSHGFTAGLHFYYHLFKKRILEESPTYPYNFDLIYHPTAFLPIPRNVLPISASGCYLR